MLAPALPQNEVVVGLTVGVGAVGGDDHSGFGFYFRKDFFVLGVHCPGLGKVFVDGLLQVEEVLPDRVLRVQMDGPVDEFVVLEEHGFVVVVMLKAAITGLLVVLVLVLLLLGSGLGAVVHKVVRTAATEASLLAIIDEFSLLLPEGPALLVLNGQVALGVGVPLVHVFDINEEYSSAGVFTRARHFSFC